MTKRIRPSGTLIRTRLRPLSSSLTSMCSERHFPTVLWREGAAGGWGDGGVGGAGGSNDASGAGGGSGAGGVGGASWPEPAGICASNSVARSEEHTSELQSRENLVCRLLLEKKKTS